METTELRKGKNEYRDLSVGTPTSTKLGAVTYSTPPFTPRSNNVNIDP